MSYDLDELKVKKSITKWIAIIILIIVLVIVSLMVGIPKYHVWTSRINIEEAENNGRAEMAKAEQNRKIKIEEAKANLEAQKLNSLAEVERAKGMAQAIEIENGKLTTKYIQYLWVRNMENNTNEKIYIATEANLPILEAKGGVKLDN